MILSDYQHIFFELDMNVKHEQGMYALFEVSEGFAIGF